MTFDTAGRVAIVTGAGQGVGLAIAATMLAAQMRVVACDLVTEHLDRLAVRYPEALSVAGLDLTEPATGQRLVETATDQFSGLDVLVNNAADIGAAVAFHETTDETWMDSLQINLLAAVRCSRAAVQVMRNQARGGAIVTIGSDAGEMPAPEFAPYSVGKAGLLSLAKVISRAYGGEGIRSNVLSLGLVRTHATAQLLDSLRREHGSEEAGVAEFTGDLGMALPRFGEPEEVAALVMFLIGPHGRQITGAAIRMDGGTVPTV